jgi:hypothetical protein
LVGGDPTRGALMTSDHVSRAVSRLSDARSVTVAGYGHNPGIDQNDLGSLLQVLGPFLHELTTR